MPKSTVWHELYSDSIFSQYRQPENVRDLHLCACIGRELQGISTPAVLESARSFSGELENLNPEGILRSIRGCTKRQATEIILKNGLHVPPSKNDANKTGDSTTRTFTPLTPSITRVSTFVRSQGNPYNPGAHLKGIILRGAPNQADAEKCWADLAKAWHVEGEFGVDDTWAILAELTASELIPSNTPPITTGENDQQWDGTPSELRPLRGWAGAAEGDSVPFRVFPARSISNDLSHLSALESRATRRMWAAIIDCYLRLAISADTLWTGRINQGLAELILQAGNGDLPENDDQLADFLTREFSALTIGSHLESTLKYEVREYAKARILINYILEKFSESKLKTIRDAGGLSRPSGLNQLLTLVKSEGKSLTNHAREQRTKQLEDDTRITRLKGSWTKNTYEFLRHALGQRMAEDQHRHFDQGYWAKKSGPAKSHPWVVDFSPLGLITMVHLAAQGHIAPTVMHLDTKLNEYGISIGVNELSKGEVGTRLRQLGLVTDSSDAEGGMIIRDPFEQLTVNTP